MLMNGPNMGLQEKAQYGVIFAGQLARTTHDMELQIYGSDSVSSGDNGTIGYNAFGCLRRVLVLNSLVNTRSP